jgi:hypothetical protein
MIRGHHLGAPLTVTFDTLGYARFLREGRVRSEQAETPADAAKL